MQSVSFRTDPVATKWRPAAGVSSNISVSVCRCQHWDLCYMCLCNNVNMCISGFGMDLKLEHRANIKFVTNSWKQLLKMLYEHNQKCKNMHCAARLSDLPDFCPPWSVNATETPHSAHCFHSVDLLKHFIVFFFLLFCYICICAKKVTLIHRTAAPSCHFTAG